MQTCLTQSKVLAGSSLAAASAQPRRARTVVAVHAQAQDTRRQLLSGLAAGLISLTAVAGANAADLRDDRSARQRGFDIIYEARDLDLDQDTRDGMSQSRQNLDFTKSRVKESEKRIDNDLAKYVKKAYWTQAREELRNQAGTLRFDLNTLIEASSKSKEEKKAATQKKKDFLLKVDELDYSIRKKDPSKAGVLLAEVQQSLDTVLSSVV
jgi:photosystem II oxygen-evolving enhancer protein 3